MNKRKYIAYVLLFLIIISGVPASANIEKMIPTEKEMGFNVSQDEIAPIKNSPPTTTAGIQHISGSGWMG